MSKRDGDAELEGQPAEKKPCPPVAEKIAAEQPTAMEIDDRNFDKELEECGGYYTYGARKLIPTVITKLY